MTSEDAVQYAVAAYLDSIGVLWCHPPNGGHRHVAVAAALKRAGTKKGVPDVLIFDTPPAHPKARGMALELKAGANRATATQRAWLESLRKRGWVAVVATGTHEALTFLRNAGYTPGGGPWLTSSI